MNYIGEIALQQLYFFKFLFRIPIKIVPKLEERAYIIFKGSKNVMEIPEGDIVYFTRYYNESWIDTQNDTQLRPKISSESFTSIDMVYCAEKNCVCLIDTGVTVLRIPYKQKTGFTKALKEAEDLYWKKRIKKYGIPAYFIDRLSIIGSAKDYSDKLPCRIDIDDNNTMSFSDPSSGKKWFSIDRQTIDFLVETTDFKINEYLKNRKKNKCNSVVTK